MSKRLVFTCIVIAGLSYLLSGCGIKPQMDFYMNPVAAGEEQRVDEKAGSVAMEKSGVSVIVSVVDVMDLLNVTSDAYANPYIRVSDWGIARPLYTVFDVTVRNNTESKVAVDPAGAVIIDENGEQYDVISYEMFVERFGAYPTLEREIVFYPHPYPYIVSYPRPYMYYRPFYPRHRWWRYPWYYHYDRYWGYRPYYEVYSITSFKRAVARGTMLKSIKLYPGGKREGLLVFPMLRSDAGELRLIIPGITILGEEKRSVEFQFNFAQTPAAKKK